MKPLILCVTGILGLLISTTAWSGSQIHIMNAWINDAPPTLKHRAGYMEIHNMSNTDMVLENATSTAFKEVEFHESILQGEQVQMREQPNIKIKAGKTISFQPGGLHLMLMNKQQDLKLDDTIVVNLTFSTGETLEVNMLIKKADNTSVHNHEHHHH